MKRKELFAVILAAVMLVGCGSDTSKEFKGDEEIHGRNTSEASSEASVEEVDGATSEESKEETEEATKEESVAKAPVEQVERTEKASAEYPFLLLNINWDTAYYPSAEDLGYTSETPSTMSGDMAGLENSKIVTYQECKGDDDFLMINLIFVDNKLSSATLDDFNGADRIDRYKEMFIEYYGEPDVKTDDETALMWYSDQATVMLDAFPNFDGDNSIQIRYLSPAKDENAKERAKMVFEAQHGTINIEINQSEG